MTDTRPPVSPVEGHYAVLRNGVVVQDVSRFDIMGVKWDDKGFWYGPNANPLDIIATIPPEFMAAVTDGRVQALIDAARVATTTFVRYGDLHAAKPDKVKADANYYQAKLLQDAITAMQGTPND